VGKSEIPVGYLTPLLFEGRCHVIMVQSHWQQFTRDKPRQIRPFFT